MIFRSSLYEQKIFRAAVAAAVALHVLAILGLIITGSSSSASQYKPLAVMDFAYYDPEGGEEGGGEGEEASTGHTPGLGEPAPVGEPEVEPDFTQPSSEPETTLTEEIQEPEAAEQKQSETPEVVTSSSDEAPPLPPLPAEKATEANPKPKPKATPKSAPKASSKVKPPSDAGIGGGALPGEVKPGGGKGMGRGGTGGGKGIGNPNALNAYASKIRAKLNRLKKYPQAAASKRVGGVVTVNFTVNRQGQVISSRLVKSSGHAALDQEALALLKRCSPFPSIPKDLPQNTINLTVPISFNPPMR